MRSLLGRFHRPFARGVDEQLLLLNNLGDGSTLSLDFTTGVLDPRLTFTRTTNATFINSQGLVEWADANMIPYSEVMSGTPWAVNGVTNTDASITNPIGGTNARLLSVTASGGSKSLAAQMTVAVGFSYTMRVWVRAGTASSVSVGYYLSTFQQCTLTKVSGPGTVSGSGSGTLYQTITGLSTTEWTQIQLVVTPSTAGSGQWYIYPNTPTNAIGDTLYIWGFQVNIGSTADPYYKTDANAYYAPRFDYDPSTLQPRGLLIEGSASNICEQGEFCWGTGATNTWSRSAGININAVNGTAGANAVARINGPDNGTLTGTSIYKDAGTQFVRSSIPMTVLASTTYTFSVYVRAPSGGNPYIRLGAFNGGSWLNTTGGSSLSSVTITNTGTAGTVFAGTPSASWIRIWVTFTTAVGQTSLTIGIYPDADTTNAATMYVWGAQVETGSGPSSVVPTGASTGNRASDNCYVDSISSWYKQGSGTMLFFGRPTVPTTRTMLNFSVGTNVPRIQMYGSTSTDVTCYLENPSGTGANIVFPSGTLVNGTAFKSAWAFETGNHAACINAGTVATASTSSPAVPSSGITRLNIGMRYDGFNQFNGHVISAKYWPVRLPNATLQAITTL
jgi:hypothetical protein